MATTRRRGRTSAAKREVRARLDPVLGLPAGVGPLGARLEAAFGRTAPRLLDVGVGDGEATVAWAAAHRDHDVVAVEVHEPSLVSTLARVDAAELTNVRVASEDVRVLLAEAEPGAVDAVRLLFPDPWPKRRHHGRRLVGPAFVARLAEVLPAGGEVHVATDWPDYADQVRRALHDDGRFTVLDGAAPPARPVTPYERAGLDAGRVAIDVVAHRR